MEMIARSKLILSHGSGACSFAVIFNKPTIQFITDQFLKEASRDTDHLKVFANWLGTELINIDESLDRDWGKYLEINQKAYENYKQHFIKKNASEKLNSWQIVANRVKKI